MKNCIYYLIIKTILLTSFTITEPTAVKPVRGYTVLPPVVEQRLVSNTFPIMTSLHQEASAVI